MMAHWNLPNTPLRTVGFAGGQVQVEKRVLPLVDLAAERSGLTGTACARR